MGRASRDLGIYETDLAILANICEMNESDDTP